MSYYASKNHDRLNGKPFEPEKHINTIMLNPKGRYRAYIVQDDTNAILDSAAFQDIDDFTRLTPFQAIQRQIKHVNEIRLRSNLPNWFPQVYCIYDQMAGVDEAIVNGKKIKIRGTEQTAAKAVEETLKAANEYFYHRNFLRRPIMYIGQGINPDQYVKNCVLPMLDLMRDHYDWFGFGGFCIIGKVPSLKPLFYQTVDRVMPLLKFKGIRRAHLLGVMVSDAVIYAAKIAKQYNILLSTDGSSCEKRATAFAHGFTAKDGWHQAYDPYDKYTLYHPNDLAIANIKEYHRWFSALTASNYSVI